MNPLDTAPRVLTQSDKIRLLTHLIEAVKKDDTAIEVSHNFVDPKDFTIRSYITMKVEPVEDIGAL